MKMKKAVSKKARVSLCSVPSSAIARYLITTALLALCYYSTVTVPMIPSALAFLATTRNAANHNCNYCDGRTNRFFVGEKEQQLMAHQERSAESEKKHAKMNTKTKRKSQISTIRCENFAGMTNGQNRESLEDENVIVLSFDDTAKHVNLCDDTMTIEECREKQERDLNETATFGGNLVCVTGETGSGKSLLVSKIADLLTGGKASGSLLHTKNAKEADNNSDSDSDSDSDDENVQTTSLPPSASAEMVLSLYDETHVSFVSKALRRMGLDPTIVLQQLDDNGSTNQQQDATVTLRLKRVMTMTPMGTNDKTNEGNDEGTPKRQRMKSTCFINGHSVSLKVLKAIATPLIAVVNAPDASTALGRPALRLSMIDSGIPASIIAWVQKLQTYYRKCKQYRMSLEKDLENQVLPASMVRRGIGDGGEDDAASDNSEQLGLLQHWIEELDGFERRISDLKDSLCSGGEVGDEELEFLLNDLNALEWTPDHNDKDQDGTSPLYEMLLDLHDYLKSLDARIIAATEARESLASLSTSDSARAALDRTRQLLMDAAGDGSSQSNSKSRVDLATEQAHEMLNLVEDAISECTNFMDDDDKGLMARLRASRRSCSIHTEELMGYITEWNVLARKHGVPPYQLPACHGTLKNELDGGIEAGKLLPGAKIAEKEAFEELKEGCRVLTEARTTLCQRVSDSISRRLPRLGMENSKFEARLCPIDSPSYSKSHLGADEVDFYLLHQDPTILDKSSNEARTDSQDQQMGGKIESVASSGEKARILLAIECEIPGSISASSDEILAVGEEDELLQHILPVAVIYDEIDAHVGGRASVSVAQMLFDQSKACQVLSITHSPSLAAIADTHICVYRGKSDQNGRIFDVVANRVEGVERRKELARMAAGDMVVDEATVFAEALLRDASSFKTRTTELQL